MTEKIVPEHSIHDTPQYADVMNALDDASLPYTHNTLSHTDLGGHQDTHHEHTTHNHEHTLDHHQHTHHHEHSLHHGHQMSAVTADEETHGKL